MLCLPGSALRALGFSARKAATILDLAQAAARGEFDLDRFEQLDDEAIIRSLVQRRGIGRWSADYVLLRGLGRLHVFPHTDIGALNGLRNFLAASGLDDNPAQALARWKPDAGILYFHLLLGVKGAISRVVAHAAARWYSWTRPPSRSRRWISAVAVADQEAGSLKQAGEAQLASLLGDPAAVRVRRGAREPDPAAGVLDEDRHVIAAQEQCLDREEIARDDARGLGLDELAPARPRASRGGTQPGPGEQAAEARR